MPGPRRSTTIPASVAALAATLAAALGAPAGAVDIVAPDAILSIAEEVEVSAAAEGVLVVLSAREGSLVAAGDALLRVDQRRAELAVEQATVELRMAAEQAKSDVEKRHAVKASELATSEHERALAIDAVSPSSVSDREINRLRLGAEVAALEVERAEHDRQMAARRWKLRQHAYRLAQAEIDDHRVAAPIAGLVVEVHKRPGEWVNRGDPVLTIVRVDRLRAEGFLPVAQATLDLAGCRAVFTTRLADGESLETRGRVTFVSPRADPVSALAQVWVELPADDRRLRPGLRGSFRITPGSAPPPAKTVANTQPQGDGQTD